jgi:hypothetical protein
MFGDEYEYWFVVPEEQLALVPSDIGADPADQDTVLGQLALHGGRITTMAPCRMVGGPLIARSACLVTPP